MFEKTLQRAFHPIPGESKLSSELLEGEISVASPNIFEKEISRGDALSFGIGSLEEGKNSRKRGEPGIHGLSQSQIQGGAGKTNFQIFFGRLRSYEGPRKGSSRKGLSPEKHLQRTLLDGGAPEIERGQAYSSQGGPGNPKIRFSLPAFGKSSFQRSGSREKTLQGFQNLGRFPEKRGLAESLERKLFEKKSQVLPGKEITRKKKVRRFSRRRSFQVEFSPEKGEFFLFIREKSPKEERKRFRRTQPGGKLPNLHGLSLSNGSLQAAKIVLPGIPEKGSFIQRKNFRKIPQWQFLRGRGGKREGEIQIGGPVFHFQALQRSASLEKFPQGKGEVQLVSPEKRTILPGKEEILEGKSLQGISLNFPALKGQASGGPEIVHSPKKKLSSEGEISASYQHSSCGQEEKQEKRYKET